MRLIGPSKGGVVGWEGRWGRRREQGANDGEQGADDGERGADGGQKRGGRANGRTSKQDGQGQRGGRGADGRPMGGHADGGKRQANGLTSGRVEWRTSGQRRTMSDELPKG